MAKNLSLGTKLLRLLLVAGAALSLAGMYLAGDTPSPVHIIFVANMVFFIVVLWMLTARKLMPRVKRLAGAMDHTAGGDLTVRVRDDSEDEFGMLNSNFNSMLERLAVMVDGVHTATRELRAIGGNVGTVAETSVGIAERQSLSAAGAKGTALEIRRSVEEVARAVDGLAGSATVNSVSIEEISASIAEIDTHIDSLAHAIERVSDAITDMTRAQKDINVSVNSLMDTSTRTAGLVGEMDSSVRFIEQNAQKTASISEGVLRDAQLGKASVETTISGIGEIHNASLTVFKVIENLSAKAANIGTILQVIDDVAEQTKLLALNASIIAAQAGKHGKGFAVVAEEIKTLARRTMTSTSEIAAIVTGVQMETGKAVEAIRFSQQKVLEGEGLSLRSGEALDKILGGVVNATAQINEIARATVEHARQSSSMRDEIEGVARMVEQILKATDAQTHNTELITDAAEGMRDLALQVRSLARANNEAGASVVNSSEAIIRMIEGIRDACRMQSTNSEAIVRMSEKMEESASGNLESTRVMEDAVSRLSRQILALEQEMSGFKTTTEV
ncbi:MAG: HAMP domain-containing protein [Deltaproteobacteria bacterium]|nr:HAMP domain-containing protein [Deltaproteobacteria bacterium]